MATAEATNFTDNIRALGDQIVKLTGLEAKSLGDYLEEVHGIKAAAVAAGPMMGPMGIGMPQPTCRPDSDVRYWSDSATYSHAVAQRDSATSEWSARLAAAS